MGRKVTKKQAASDPTFTTSAMLEFEIEGERFTDEYEIVYFALSSKVLRVLCDDPEGVEVTEKNRNVVAEQLAVLVKQIPDITGDDGETPAVCDAAFFDGLSLPNLKAINDAVKDDINPKKAQPDS